ncbi:DMT family transporter [Ochrobactrum sp. AN78]|uniref:DMT family transporter n=1 Tax=Ochrobactrum sp. AN78 TaxID=3039853 RepID=UPI002989CF45|nr:DMT family transporter [Ochrobactrum sp. AN78]MDH7789333.1 drug/metabolite transporter (DMT)-like permease [Ochrobactrum sp. AN78]
MTATTDSTISVSANDTIKGLLWGLSGVLVWSGSFVLTRFGFKTALMPSDIIALRFGVAGLVLLPVVFAKGFGFRQLGPLGFVLLASGAGFPYALLTVYGLQFAPASHAAALIPGLMTALVAILGVLLLQERLALSRWAGVVLILIGSGLIAGLSQLGGQEMIGHLSFFAAALVWSIYVMVFRRKGMDGLHATAIAAVTSALVFLPIYVLFLKKGIGETAWGDIALQGFYQGVLTSAFGVFAFNRAVVLLGTAAGAALSALIPVATLVLALLLLGEVPGWTDTTAALLISLGVLALNRKGRKYRACRA